MPRRRRNYTRFSDDSYGRRRNRPDAFTQEQMGAPPSSNNQLIWRFDNYSNGYKYDGLIPGLEISSRVSDYVLQEFFAELRKMRNYNYIGMKKKYGCTILFMFLLVFIYVFAFSMFMPGYDQFIYIPIIVFFASVGLLIWAQSAAIRKRKNRIDVACAKFTFEKLRPFSPSCILTCSKHQSYLMLTDMNIGLGGGVVIIQPAIQSNIGPQIVLPNQGLIQQGYQVGPPQVAYSINQQVPTQPPTNQPMQYQAPGNQPVYQAPGNQPVYQAPTNQPVYQAPTNQPMYPAPGNQPMYPAPENQQMYPAPENQPMYPTNQQEYAKNQP